MIHALHFFALVQATIGVLVFVLPKALGWGPALAAMPRLMREVYHVHAFYLSVTLWIFAGFTVAFGEEMLVRGFMMNRLAQLFGSTRAAWATALVISAVIFGLMHVYQGTMGVLLTGAVGLVFGAAYLIVRRNLWVTIIAHGVIDTLAFVAFYFGMVKPA